MKAGDRRFTVEWIRSGQPRPYADSTYEFIITSEFIPYTKENNYRKDLTAADFVLQDINGDWIKDIAKKLGRNWLEVKSWPGPWLQSMTKDGVGRYRFVVVEEFTD